MNDYVFENIISGKNRVTNHTRKENFTPEQYTKLQEYYSKRKYISPIECSLWLDIHINTVYALLKNNGIPHIKIDVNRGLIKIDVEKTKKMNLFKD